MVKEHLTEAIRVEQIRWRGEHIAHREIVLQFLVVEADFKAIETLGISIMVKDILLVGMAGQEVCGGARGYRRPRHIRGRGPLAGRSRSGRDRQWEG